MATELSVISSSQDDTPVPHVQSSPRQQQQPSTQASIPRAARISLSPTEKAATVTRRSGRGISSKDNIFSDEALHAMMCKIYEHDLKEKGWKGKSAGKISCYCMRHNKVCRFAPDLITFYF